MPFELLAQVQDNADAARQMLEQAATTPEVAPVMETISVWELIQNGGWYIMGPLALMSLIAVYIIIERSLAIKRALREEKDFMEKIKDHP